MKRRVVFNGSVQKSKTEPGKRPSDIFGITIKNTKGIVKSSKDGKMNKEVEKAAGE